jgi:membrane protein YqaA with SNARE-associated domain
MTRAGPRAAGTIARCPNCSLTAACSPCRWSPRPCFRSSPKPCSPACCSPGANPYGRWCSSRASATSPARRSTGLGRGIEHFRDRRWFPVKPAALARAERWYGRYGRWSLLLSWAPVIGDPLTMIAGVLREPLPTFLVIVTIAKVGRYLAVAWLVMH